MLRAPVNLDYAASTPLRPEARAAMDAYDEQVFAGANPNSLHTLGRQASAELERLRRELAHTFGPAARADEVIFTSGGTESCALALWGCALGVRQKDRARNRVIVSALEHDALLHNVPRLRDLGFVVQELMPARSGVVSSQDLEELIEDDVAVVCCMLANNETGVIQPIPELAACAHAHGARYVCDAVQGWLHTPFDVDELGVDCLCVAGHKIGGPVGIGALYLRRNMPMAPLLQGGGQERGLRPGTQDVRAICGFVAAAKLLHANLARDHARVLALSERLYKQVLAHPRIHATMGNPWDVDRLPGIVSLYLEGIESEDAILALDEAGFAVSAGSACSASAAKASHVLTAMGLSNAEAICSLRVSFDDRVHPEDLDRFAQALNALVDAHEYR